MNTQLTPIKGHYSWVCRDPVTHLPRGQTSITAWCPDQRRRAAGTPSLYPSPPFFLMATLIQSETQTFECILLNIQVDLFRSCFFFWCTLNMLSGQVYILIISQFKTSPSFMTGYKDKVFVCLACFQPCQQSIHHFAAN